MWSLIPWRTLLKLALPFIREIFVGKFNAKQYFVKHPIITFCVIGVTILSLLIVFITEQAIYHAVKSHEYRERIQMLEKRLDEKKEHKTISPIDKPSIVDDDGSKEKEVVLVPTTPKPDPIPVHKLIPTALTEKPVPKVPKPIPIPSPKEIIVYNNNYLNERLKQINEVE